MKSELLKKAIELVTSAVDGAVFFQVKDNILKVGATNAMNGVVASARVNHADLYFVIPHVFARQITRILNKPETDFAFEGENVLIQCGRSKMKIGCLPDGDVSEVSIMSKFSSQGMFNINGNSFVAALQKVKHNANDNSLSDATLLGFHVCFKKEYLEFMTTNARALARTSFPINNVAMGDKLVIVNSKFETIVKLINAEAKIGLTDNALSLWSKDEDGVEVKAVCALVKGTPRQYEKIFTTITQACHSEVHFKKKELQEVIKVLEFFGDKEEKLRVKFTFSEDSLHVTTSTSKGASENYIDYSKIVKLKEKSLTITLHPDIILKAIGSISGDTVVIKFGESKSPIHVSDGSVENILTVFL